MEDFTKVDSVCGYVVFTCAKNGKQFAMDPNLAMDFARRVAAMAREAGATNIEGDDLEEELLHP